MFSQSYFAFTGKRSILKTSLICSHSTYISTARYYKYSYLNVCNVVMADYVAAINIVARVAVKQTIVVDLRLTSKIPYQLSYISIC
jgi:hypothetical protein